MRMRRRVLYKRLTLSGEWSIETNQHKDVEEGQQKVSFRRFDSTPFHADEKDCSTKDSGQRAAGKRTVGVSDETPGTVNANRSGNLGGGAPDGGGRARMDDKSREEGIKGGVRGGDRDALNAGATGQDEDVKVQLNFGKGTSPVPCGRHRGGRTTSTTTSVMGKVRGRSQRAPQHSAPRDDDAADRASAARSQGASDASQGVSVTPPSGESFLSWGSPLAPTPDAVLATTWGRGGRGYVNVGLPTQQQQQSPH